MNHGGQLITKHLTTLAMIKLCNNLTHSVLKCGF